MLRFSLLVLLSRRAETPRLFTHTCPHCTKETAAKVQHNVLGEGKEKARGRALAYWMKAFDQDGDGKIPIERLIKTTPPHRLFHRISIYVRTIFCWDHASFMLASRQSFIGSASAPVSFALDSRRFHVSFASDSRRNRRKHAAKDRSAAPLERATSGADAPLRWQRKNRAPTLPSTRTVCSWPPSAR